MSDSIRKTIDELEERRKTQLSEVARTERTINDLLGHIGESPRYVDSIDRQSNPASDSINVKITRGQFYGKPLATAVREYLQERKPVPAKTEEILEALNAGEFDFVALGWKKDTRVRALAMSLAKNTATFHRLPSGTFGLKEWYPNLGGKQ
jgi:hypothetical protein